VIQSSADLAGELQHRLSKDNDEAIATPGVESKGKGYAAFHVETVAGQQFLVVVSEIHG
jgi:hypothetical protein